MNDFSFSKQQHNGKGPEMMAFHTQIEVEGDEAMQFEGEPYLDNVAQQMQNLFEFRIFYDHMDFSSDQCLVITEAIIELISSSRRLRPYLEEAMWREPV